MPSVLASLEYLQDLELYEREKPYWAFLQPHDGFDPDKVRLDNLEFEQHDNIAIEDIRDLEKAPSLETHAFEVLQHTSSFVGLDTPSDIEHYRAETEVLLKERLGAIYLQCYDHRLRKNVTFERAELDLKDPLLTEGPARGAHNDITASSGPYVIRKYMSEADLQRYVRRGFRVRIINTWRSLLPVLYDRPLALLDSHSVSGNDLIAADRIIPDGVGEVYYLKHNPKHQWYWLSEQTVSELLLFVMYDTKSGSHARFCPHVSFSNPIAPAHPSPRHSIETRSIVITKE